MFDIADCDGSTMVIMDNCEQVQIDCVKNSRIFVGACASSIFIRNCSNTTFYTCCRQLRLRDCENCKFYIYSMSEVHIEYSNGLLFASFNGGYAQHADHLAKAHLDVSKNLWYDIFDHNDPGKTREHWGLLPESEYEEPWFPDGSGVVAVPRTKPNSVARVEQDSNMQAFGFEQLRADAAKSVAPPAAPPAATSTATTTETSAGKADTSTASIAPLPPPGPVKVAIIGAGDVGFALYDSLLRIGTSDVVIGSRDPTSEKVISLLAAHPGTKAIPIKEATAWAEVIILAVPGMRTVEDYTKCLESLGGASNTRGKVCCCTNWFHPHIS
jgi:protein XRP2